MRYSIILLLFAGCAIQQPPEYFLRNIGEVKYVDRLPHQGLWRLAETGWDGTIYIKNIYPLFVSRHEILIHEQAHSFEILAAKNRPREYRRFRLEFDKTYKSKYVEVEEFPKAVIRALKGKKDKGALLALKFIRGKI